MRFRSRTVLRFVFGFLRSLSSILLCAGNSDFWYNISLVIIGADATLRIPLFQSPGGTARLGDCCNSRFWLQSFLPALHNSGWLLLWAKYPAIWWVPSSIGLRLMMKGFSVCVGWTPKHPRRWCLLGWGVIVRSSLQHGRPHVCPGGLWANGAKSLKYTSLPFFFQPCEDKRNSHIHVLNPYAAGG